MATRKVAAYVRVSTGKQDHDSQRHAIEQYCEQNNLTIDRWYTEVRSGRNHNLTVRDQMISDLKKQKIHTIIVFGVDRLSREKVIKALNVLNEIYEQPHARLISIREPFLDIANESMRMLMLSFFSMIAHEESRSIGERVKAGQAKARAAGAKVGRIAHSEVRLAQAVEAYVSGAMSSVQAAEHFNVNKASITRRARRMAAEKSALSVRDPSAPADASNDPTQTSVAA